MEKRPSTLRHRSGQLKSRGWRCSWVWSSACFSILFFSACEQRISLCTDSVVFACGRRTWWGHGTLDGRTGHRRCWWSTSRHYSSRFYLSSCSSCPGTSKQYICRAHNYNAFIARYISTLLHQQICRPSIVWGSLLTIYGPPTSTTGATHYAAWALYIYSQHPHHNNRVPGKRAHQQWMIPIHWRACRALFVT